MLNEQNNQTMTSEVVQLLSHQTQYIDHIEKENSSLLEELQVFKQRLVEVINENQTIHDNVQAKLVLETLDQSHAIIDESIKHKIPDETISADSQNHSNERISYKENILLRDELESVKTLYSAKTSGFREEIEVVRRSLQETLNENEDLKFKLKQITKNSRKSSEVHAKVNIPIIERLTSERDDLLKSVTSLRASINQSQSRESELHRQLQKSLSALEEIQLQKTEVLVEKEQLKEDLKNIHKKFEEEISEGPKRILDAASLQRKNCIEEINELQRKVGELVASCSHYEDEIEKAGKEKVKMELKFEESRSQLHETEKELSKMRAEIQHEVKSALKGYSGAEQELREAKLKLEQELLKAKQERTRFEQESVELHQRIKSSELHVLTTQEINLKLTEKLNIAQVKNDQGNIKINALVKKFETQEQNLHKSMSEKIEKLTKSLKETEIEYESRLTDLEEICAKQSNLIGKLRNECKNIEGNLDKIAKKYRVEVGELTQKLEENIVRIKRLTLKNDELSKQCVQHGITHRYMNERLLTVNDRAHVSTNHVMKLLDKQTQLAKEKEFLSKEVQFLHSQVIQD